MGHTMTIVKLTGSEGGFCIVPNTTLNDALSWEAIGLLAYLCSKPDNWRVSVKQLCNHSHKSTKPSGRDKTYRILKELQDAGYVKRVKTREGNGTYREVHYVVSPQKLKDRNIADLFNPPLPENPDVVKLKGRTPLPEKPEVDETQENQQITGENGHIPDSGTQPLPENPDVDSAENPPPLPENPDVDEHANGQPLPDLPDTANTTLQKKENKKRKSVITREKNTLKAVKQNQAELLRDTQSPSQAKPKAPFTDDFLEFWQHYPQTTGSKKTAFGAWKRLNKAKKQEVMASLPNYKKMLEKWGKDPSGRYFVLHPNKYIRDEHYKTYQPAEPILEPAESVLINDRRFLHKTVIEACVTYYRSGEWRLNSMLGPPPDDPNTAIPKFLIAKAGKIVRGQK